MTTRTSVKATQRGKGVNHGGETNIKLDSRAARSANLIKGEGKKASE